MAPEVRGWLVSGGVESCTCGTFCSASRMDAPAEWAITDSSLGEGEGQVLICCCLRRRRLKVLAVEEQREIHGLPSLSMQCFNRKARRDGFVGVNQVQWRESKRCPWRPVYLFFHFWGGLFGFFGEHESPPTSLFELASRRRWRRRRYVS